MTPSPRDSLYFYRGLVRSIYDGDTWRIDIDLGFQVWLRNQSVRLYGIDTPEVRGVERPAGIEVRDLLRKTYPPNTEILLESIRDKTGKFGRWLGVIWVGDLCVNEWLLSNGFALPYLEGVRR